MSEYSSQAKAVRAATRVAPVKPARKTCLCPRRSPSFPSSGKKQAESSMGAEMTQASVVSGASNSSAIGA